MNRADGFLHSPYPVHVVVLNWNLPRDTMACVDSVRASAMIQPQIIVVDNGSTDRSLESFEQRYGDAVDLVACAENLGFAGGANAGIKKALSEGAQSVLILNNDTIVDRDMVANLILAGAQSPHAGIIGPVVRHYDRPQDVWRFGDREYRWLPVPLQLPDRVLDRAGQTPFRVDYVTGCGMLVWRRVFETIGLFDPHYFMYFEDADFCRRAREAGFEIWCAPQAQMWHKVSSSARRQRPAMRYAESWGRARFYRRHRHGWSRGLTSGYLLARLVTSTLRDALTGEWGLIKPAWIGMLDGWCDKPSRMSDFLG